MEGLNRSFAFPKLSSACLKTVTRNFDRFMASSTKDGSNLVFLQIAYATELFEELAGTEHFEKYMDFLLNDYLKEVDLDLCKNINDPGHVVERLKNIGNSLKKLVVPGRTFTKRNLLALIPRMPNIKSLIFRCDKIDKNVLERIGQFCTAIENLDVSYNRNVTDDALQALCPSTKSGDVSECQNHKLKYLNLQNTSVSVVGINFLLKHFPTIVHIDNVRVVPALCHSHADMLTPYNSSLLSRPHKTYNLQELYFDFDCANVKIMKTMSDLCPCVTKLIVIRASQLELIAFVGFSNLKKIRFYAPRVRLNYSLFLKSRGMYLQELYLTKGNVILESLPEFCPVLELLKLDSVKLQPKSGTESDIKYTFEHLTFLSFDYMNFSDEHVADSATYLLSVAPMLKTLSVCRTSLSLSFTDSLIEKKCLTSIQELNAPLTNVEPAVAHKLISAAANLRVFRIDFSTYPSEDVTRMQALHPKVHIQDIGSSWLF